MVVLLLRNHKLTKICLQNYFHFVHLISLMNNQINVSKEIVMRVGLTEDLALAQ